MVAERIVVEDTNGDVRTMVVIDEARFERLQETAMYAFRTRYSMGFFPFHGPISEEGARLRKAVFAHQHGDFDDLP